MNTEQCLPTYCIFITLKKNYDCIIECWKETNIISVPYFIVQAMADEKLVISPVL